MSILTLARLKQLFHDLPRGNVLVYGDVMIDQYLWGKVDRISPEAPVPVVEVESETLQLGGAANVARNISALGCNAELVGLVGDDDNATRLKHLLEREGIRNYKLVSDQKRPTTVKTRVIAHNQQVVRADRESRAEIDGYTENEMVSYIESRLPETQCLLISDYGKGVITLPLLQRIVPLARKRNRFIAVDPKESHFRNYRQVSVITPNEHEAAFAAGQRIRDDESLQAVGWGLLKELELDSILVTLGARGMALFEKDGSFNHLPTVAKKVYDVTGAGDTVIAVLTAMMAAGATRLEAAFVANQAAGIVVGYIGTAYVGKDELFNTIAESL
ncbi:MAG: D-glycero-beta-D-manno-heptose-7-phosphate kinase [candidate division Zixibacteria bacterium]|nr:D-glycero-beta-D-manno-heptose-7-phosphate kinase [candidate division Zixibacteria bacterium]